MDSEKMIETRDVQFPDSYLRLSPAYGEHVLDKPDQSSETENVSGTVTLWGGDIS